MLATVGATVFTDLLSIFVLAICLPIHLSGFDPKSVLIEILWSAGRSVKVKKVLLADLMQRLQAAGRDPENVMVCFKETTWENWAFAGGRLIHT